MVRGCEVWGREGREVEAEALGSREAKEVWRVVSTLCQRERMGAKIPSAVELSEE